MLEILHAAGCNLKRLHRYSNDEIEAGVSKLEAPAVAFAAIYKLKSPEWWDNLAMLGAKGFREQLLIEPLRVELKKQFNETFPRRKNDKAKVEPSVGGSGDQSTSPETPA